VTINAHDSHVTGIGFDKCIKCGAGAVYIVYRVSAEGEGVIYGGGISIPPPYYRGHLWWGDTACGTLKVPNCFLPLVSMSRLKGEVLTAA
jgi:hypothetical protein